MTITKLEALVGIVPIVLTWNEFANTHHTALFET
jgi:hypothetical protein